MWEKEQIFSQTSLRAQEKYRMSACDSSPHCLDCDGAQVTFTPAAHGAQWRLHTQTRSPASWGVFSDAPKSEGDDRIHGYSPNATIFYDYAFPLSTSRTDDIDLFSAAQSPSRDEITQPMLPLTISQRHVKPSVPEKNLNVQENLIPGIAVSDRLHTVCVFECFQLVGRPFL